MEPRIAPVFTQRITPPNADPFGGSLRYICVNYQWIAPLLGVASVLMERDIWDTSDNELLDETIKRAEHVLYQLSGMANCGSGDIMDIRIDGCDLQVYRDGQWETVGSLGDCVGQGLPGKDGLTGYPGADAPVPGDLNTTDLAVACAVADFTANYLAEKMNDILDLAEAGINAGKQLSFLCADILEIVMGWTQVTVGTVETIKDLVSNAVDTTFSAIRAADTIEWRSEIKCQLYSRLKPTAGSFGTDRTIINQWRADTFGKAFVGQVFAGTIDICSLQTFQFLARVAQNNEGECDDCGWCYTWDFTQGDGGWALVPYSPSLGEYLTDTGWHSTQVGNNEDIWIAVDVPTDTELTGVKADYLYNGSQAFSRYWSTHDDASDSFGFGNSSGGSGSFYDTGNWTVSTDGTLQLYCQSNGQPGNHDITIARITVYGSGSNPFGTDNC